MPAIKRAHSVSISGCSALEVENQDNGSSNALLKHASIVNEKYKFVKISRKVLMMNL